MECVDNLDGLFEFSQLLFHLILGCAIYYEYIHQIVGQKLTRVTDVDGRFCVYNIQIVIHKQNC